MPIRTFAELLEAAKAKGPKTIAIAAGHQSEVMLAGLDAEVAGLATAIRNVAPVKDFFVQVLASSKQATIEEARTKLVSLGFPRDHQHLITVQNPGSAALYKLRIGPFLDRPSADRVSQRMSAAGFPDSWVVAP